ncbi:unnamed protein product [Allacma fusca]|uniref:WAP domain-containing protein n=1 Tax=Allacma fusca TaxID=39272 RepID=A0A8J2NRI3_9HEXA|nr:unnamed protein product [Allacma fusca]
MRISFSSQFGVYFLGLYFMGSISYASAICGQGNSNRFRACPYNPPGLQVTRGLAGACPVGTDVIGDCITDDDCFLKKMGNVCCYNRCRGLTECHRFP